MSIRLDHTVDESYEDARDYLIKAEMEYWATIPTDIPHSTFSINNAPLQLAWGDPSGTRGGSLFLYVTRTGYQRVNCGCLTQIRGGTGVERCGTQYLPAEFCNRIRNDTRLPASSEELKVSSLDAFVEWQNAIDKAYTDIPAES